jgi:hypothetical protein
VTAQTGHSHDYRLSEPVGRDGWRLCNVSAAVEKDSDTFVGRAIVTVNIEPAPGV